MLDGDLHSPKSLGYQDRFSVPIERIGKCKAKFSYRLLYTVSVDGLGQYCVALVLIEISSLFIFNKVLLRTINHVIVGMEHLEGYQTNNFCNKNQGKGQL